MTIHIATLYTNKQRESYIMQNAKQQEKAQPLQEEIYNARSNQATRSMQKHASSRS